MMMRTVNGSAQKLLSHAGLIVKTYPMGNKSAGMFPVQKFVMVIMFVLKNVHFKQLFVMRTVLTKMEMVI